MKGPVLLPDDVTQDQRLLIERFEVAFNRIEQHLRQQLHRSSDGPFGDLVRDCQKAGKLSPAQGVQLVEFGRLRNALVHGHTASQRYLAVPAQSVVCQLEQVRDHLISPEVVIPRFQTTVVRVSYTDSLAEVLEHVAMKGYSQFPVYEGPNFKGLLTENGITRWLARHVCSEDSLVEIKDVIVKQLLREEEKRPVWEFVDRTATVDAVRAMFAQHEQLEAVLITQNGNRNESLLGMATRWDMARISHP